eukprot:SAG22_NODE_116_length_19306_cov_247.696517_13_plen_102_part_00
MRSRSGRDNDGTIDLADFKKFVRRRELKIRSVFEEIDSDKNGYIDARDVVKMCRRLGVEVAPVSTAMSTVRRRRLPSLVFPHVLSVCKTAPFLARRLPVCP